MQKLLKGDDFYKIRVPSNVLNLSGREYVVSSVKAVSLELLCLKLSAYVYLFVHLKFQMQGVVFGVESLTW